MDKKVYEFIASQTGEKIVERKNCPNCGQEFAITDKDMEFYSKISPVFNGTKYEIPAPTLCPDCRLQRRLTRRNERKLYKRKCDLTGKDIISIYSEDKKDKVYSFDEWGTYEKWDPMEYGRDIDFSRPFFEQFNELLLQVPKNAIFYGSRSENSIYNNYTSNLKDCYLVFDSMNNERCMHSLKVSFGNDCVDCSYTIHSENCYECTDCMRSYNLFFGNSCTDCRDSYFLYNCNNCLNCFGCVGLDNKQYYIYNEEYTKEEYFKIIEKYLLKIKLWEIDEIKEKVRDLQNSTPRRNLIMNNVENSFWNNLDNSKNSIVCFDSFNLQNCKYSAKLHSTNDSYDFESWGDNCNLVYEWIAVWTNAYKALFGVCTWSNPNNIIYCCFISKCSDLFGCVWLKNKQYCILNKQYTKEEYEALVPKIIEHMQRTWERWEFFPIKYSPFGYNETVAEDIFPLSKDQVIDKWYKRMDKEYPINVPEWIELVRAQDLPDNISDVKDDILKKAVICEVSWKPFRIIKPELDFYRKHNLPLPRKHPDVRHLERLSQRAPRNLYLRTCNNCGKQIVSVYPADSEFKVYCEECYNKQVY